MEFVDHEEGETKNDRQIQIRFVNPDSNLQPGLFPSDTVADIPDYPLTVDDSLTYDHLHALLSRLVQEDGKTETDSQDVRFDFLIKNQLVRQSLAEELEWHNLTRESVLEIEVVQATSAPKPPKSLPHEDWVSCCLGTRWDRLAADPTGKGNGSVIITGTYDCSVNVWNTEGTLMSTSVGHTGPLKCLAEVGSSPGGTFSGLVTGSMDQTLKLWRPTPTGLVPSVKCIGHESSVEAVAVCPQPDVHRMVSVGFDSFLKCWDTTFPEDMDGPAGDPTEEGGSRHPHSNKRARRVGGGEGDEGGVSAPQDQRYSNRSPLVTLAGHTGPVYGVTWGSANNRVITASWDLSIKTWELDLAGPSDSVTIPVAPTSLAYSELNGGLVAVGATDPMVRILDLRSREGSGSPVKTTLTSHTAWVSGVAWSPTRPHLLASGSYDNLVKMWDLRSPRAPLFDLAGHTERVLGIAWLPGDSALASGGADSTLQLYSF